MKIHFVGDVECHIEKLIEIDQTTDADIIIQVGDLGLFKYRDSLENNPKYKPGSLEYQKALYHWHELRTGEFNSFNHPLYSIAGTNEDFRMRREDASWCTSYNIYPMTGSVIKTFGSRTRVAFLGGIFSSKRYGQTWHGSLPYREDRFIRKSDIEHLAKHGDDIDILVTHQAMTDVLPHREEGSEIIHTLFDCLQPSLYIHGNHHTSYETTCKGADVIGLGNISKDETAQTVKQFTEHDK